jgi:DNA (cytosine-5)-methyltransferase 1
MRYLSVCSGIEAATAAWHHMGWQPAAFSEIEPFPSAVLAHHYPNVPNVGDITKYEDWNVGQIDLLVGGTPCQAFSVAGLRGGLSDARGNLSLVFCKMADHFDPEFVLWENVPGVLSSTDNAFGCFLAGLCGASDPLTPGRKWSSSGVVSGPKRTVAWRTLDAQFFGVAQRRRRVFVLAVRGAGNWAAAQALFPVGEGVCWNSAPSRKAGKDVAPTIAGCANGGGANGPGRDVDSVESLQITHSHWDGDYPHPTLNRGSGGVGMSNQEIFSQRGAYLAPQATTYRMVAFGEYVDDRAASAMKTRDHKDATGLAVTHSLRGEGFDASEDGTGRGTPLVPVHVPEVAGTMKACKDSGGWSNSADHVAAGYMVPVSFSAQMSVPQTDVGLCQTLQAKNPTAVLQPVTYDLFNVTAPVNRQNRTPGDPCHTLACSNAEHAAVVGFDAYNNGVTGDVSKTIDTGQHYHHVPNLLQAMQVRRLTPVECERLQGFPDNFTAISWRKAEAADCPDGPRYKALGNSMAVPVMRWIGERIQGVHQ